MCLVQIIHIGNIEMRPRFFCEVAAHETNLFCLLQEINTWKTDYAIECENLNNKNNLQEGNMPNCSSNTCNRLKSGPQR